MYIHGHGIFKKVGTDLDPSTQSTNTDTEHRNRTFKPQHEWSP